MFIELVLTNTSLELRALKLKLKYFQVAGKDDETGEPLVQREDDKPESVRNRLEVFQANTEPVLEFYRKMNICQDFHGTESKKIWPHVESYLKSIL